MDDGTGEGPPQEVAAPAPDASAAPGHGLERLRRQARIVSRLLAIGGLVLTVPIVLVRRDADGFVGLLSTGQVAVAAVLGLLAVLVASVLLFRTGLRAGRAARAGASWFAIAESVADRTGNTAALIAGTGEHAALGPAARGQIRVLRLFGAGAAFLSAALPPVSLLVAARLVGTGRLAPDFFAPAVLAPTVLAALVAALASRRERALLREAGRPSREGRRPLHERSRPLAALAARLEAMDARASRDVRPRSRLAAATLTVLLALAIVGPAVTTALVPLVALGLERLVSTNVLLPLGNVAAARLRMIEVGRRYRLPTDPAITLDAAGRAYYRVISAELGAGARISPLQKPVPDPIRQRWEPDRPPWSGAPDSLIRRARSGLTEQERAYVERAAAHPGFGDWAIVARAPALDSFAAHAVLPLPPNLIMWALPFPLFSGIQGAARVQVARAALQLSAGRADEAELTLRETVSFGVVLADASDTLIQSLIGVAILGIGLNGLEAFYEATGRAGEARALGAAIAASSAWSPPDIDLSHHADLERSLILKELESEGAPRGIRWARLHNVVFLPCTTVSELLIGPRADITRSIGGARRDFALLPGERAKFEVVEQTTARMAATVRREPGAGSVVASALGSFLGNDMLTACGGLAVMLHGG